MEKYQLRDLYINKRNTLSYLDVVSKSEFISTYIINKLDLDEKKIHCFKSIPNSHEINTSMIFEHCLNEGINIATSITKRNPNILEHTWVRNQTIFSNGAFNVPVPSPIYPIDLSSLDTVFIPLLCIDKKGNRIGYGKGYYDSFLKVLPEKTYKIGLSFFPPIDEEISTDTWDIPLNGLITPECHYHF